MSNERLLSLSRYFNMLLLVTVLCCQQVVRAEWVSHEFEAMGTRMHVSLFHVEEKVRQQALQRVQQEMVALDKKLSFYDENSELMQLNQATPQVPISVSQTLFDILEQAERLAQLTNGAFDVSIGALARTYQLRESIAPEPHVIAKLKQAVNYRSIQLDKHNRTVTLTAEGVALDLGGIAKGYAVDRCIEILEKKGIRQAQVTAGGDTRFLGRRGERPWWIGIRHPRIKTENALVLPLESQSISTSGDYERFFLNGEDRVHHILNPQTGQPTKELASVSIVTRDSVWADGLSTAVFVMGTQKGLELINQLPGVEGVLIDQEGRVLYSDGFENLSASNQAIQLAMPKP